jgi:acyl-CoA synthetase (AMP-forming)/AMP-acid ligase II
VHADDAAESTSETGYVAAIDPDSLAFIQLTSGSTSTPKGVMRSHRSQLAGLQLTLAAREMTPESHVVSWDAPHVGRATSNVMRALIAGVPATLLDTESVLERPGRWLRAISRVRGTHANASNFAFDLCTKRVSEEEKAELDLSPLVSLGCGGETVRPDTLDRFVSAFAPCGLRREALTPRYSATEAGAISTVRARETYAARHFDRVALEDGPAATADGRDSEAAPTTRRLVGCGPPLDGVDVRIVDPAFLTPCDPGSVGEIWVSSPAVALGYLQQPEETERVFHAHLAGSGEGPFCRTGDLGFMHEGEIFITGRLKEMIIIRGRNVYAVDVENTVQTCLAGLEVGTSAAFSIEAGGEERLAVVVEVAPTLTADELEGLVGAIRHAVAERHGIQAYTIALVPPAGIPRVTMGKIGRAECRQRLLAGTLPVLSRHTLHLDSIRTRVPYRAPQTATERALVPIWEAVLAFSGIGVDDTFADLGGDSLLSVQLLMAMTEAGVPINAEDLGMRATIAHLSRTIDARPVPDDRHRAPGTGSVLLTWNQIELLSSEGAALTWSRGTHVLGTCQAVDLGLLARAVQHLQFHHDALRLRCRPTGAGWRAEYAGHTPLAVPSVVDLSGCEPDVQRSRVRDEAARLQASLDVERGPMVNVGVVRLDDSRNLVLIALHHIVSDELSGTIIVRDLDTLYHQLVEGETPRLPARTATVNEWLRAGAAYAKSPAIQLEAEYWLRVCAHPPSGLPVDHPPTSGRAGTERVVEAWLDERTTAALHDVRRRGLSLADVLHYALARALSDELKTDTVQFQTMTHGRSAIFPKVDLSRTVGFLATEFPVMLHLEPDEDRLNEVRAVRVQLEAIPHHGMGFVILTARSPSELRSRLISRQPWRTRLNYVGTKNHRYGRLAVFRAARDWRAVLDESGEAETPIPWNDRVEVTASIQEEGLLLWIVSNSAAYERATIERFARGMLEILRDLALRVGGQPVPAVHRP